MPMPIPNWQALQQAADRAQLGADQPRAVELYTAALAQPGAPWTAICALRLARARSWLMLGDFAAIERDLSELAEQAAAAGDDLAHATALTQAVVALRSVGDLARCRAMGEEAVRAAARTSSPEALVAAYFALSLIQFELGDFKALQMSVQAAEARLTPADALGQIKTAFARAALLMRTGDHHQSLLIAEGALRLARAQGWRDWEAHCQNLIAIVTPDLAYHCLLYTSLQNGAHPARRF